MMPHLLLGHATNNQRRNTLLLTPHINLHRHTSLCTESHPHHRRHLAACDGLTVEFERVC